MKKSLNQLAKERAESLGWEVELTEYYDKRTQRRHDLLGFADLICLNTSQSLLLQVTSGSNHAARRKKILGNANARLWAAATGRRIQVWSHRVNAAGEGVWREEEIALEDFV